MLILWFSCAKSLLWYPKVNLFIIFLRGWTKKKYSQISPYISKHLLNCTRLRCILFTFGMKVVLWITKSEHDFFFLNQSHRVCILNNQFNENAATHKKWEDMFHLIFLFFISSQRKELRFNKSTVSTIWKWQSALSQKQNGVRFVINVAVRIGGGVWNREKGLGCRSSLIISRLLSTLIQDPILASMTIKKAMQGFKMPRLNPRNAVRPVFQWHCKCYMGFHSTWLQHAVRVAVRIYQPVLFCM